MEDSRSLAQRSLSLHSSSSSILSSSCLYNAPRAAAFHHETSSSISKRQPGILTTTSASLCYYLPWVCQLQTLTDTQFLSPGQLEIQWLAKLCYLPLSQHTSLRRLDSALPLPTTKCVYQRPHTVEIRRHLITHELDREPLPSYTPHSRGTIGGAQQHILANRCIVCLRGQAPQQLG